MASRLFCSIAILLLFSFPVDAILYTIAPVIYNVNPTNDKTVTLCAISVALVYHGYALAILISAKVYFASGCVGIKQANDERDVR